jgi:hypothetical protein
MAVVDMNKNLLYNLVRPSFGRLMVHDPSTYFYKGLSIPC